jgi:PST family polysaccharide transporter
VIYTPDFLPMERLFGWQLAGDLFKIASWLLAYIMAAKAMTMAFIITEIVFTGLFTIIAFLLVRINGIVGITQGYLVNYAIYFLTMIIVFRKILFYKFTD